MGISPFKIFDAPTREYTLAEVVNMVIEQKRKRGKRLAKSTLKDYQTLINHWDRLIGRPVDDIDLELMCEFQSKLCEETDSDREIQTVNKIMRYLCCIVAFCFPPDRKNKQGFGIFSTYFSFPLPLKAGSLHVPRTIPEDVINRLYETAFLSKYPRCHQVSGEQVWQLAYVLGYNLGPRTYDLFGLEWQGKNSRIDFDDYNGVGSIQYYARKTEKTQRVPMNPVVRQHLLAMPRCFGNRVFPECFHRNNRGTNGQKFKDNLQRAGLDRDSYVFEDFRKTANTAYEIHAPGVGQYVLGHSLKGVNAMHYVDPTKPVFDAVSTLPQPAAFTAGSNKNKEDHSAC